MKNKTAYKVIVVGATNFDVLAMPDDCLKVDDSSPGLVRYSAGGVGRNIAEGLSRLSMDCCLYSLVGDDLPGEYVLSLCRAAGLVTEFIAKCEGAPTSVYVSMNENDGSMVHAVSDMSLIDSCQMTHFPTLATSIAGGDLCVIDANLPTEVIKKIAGSCGNTPLVADAVSSVKCRKLAEVLPVRDLLKANYTEAVQLADVDEDTEIEPLAEALLATGLSSVLITLGADGAVVVMRKGSRLQLHHSPAAETQIVSINGAGDAMLSGFIAARLYGLDVQVQLQWGVEAARLSLESEHACSEQLTLNHLQCLQPRAMT